ncbi:MAG: hypothetical protein QXQ91_05070 [Nanopusillaceae archaeon]
MSVEEYVKIVVEELENVKKQYESLNVDDLSYALNKLNEVVRFWKVVQYCLEHTCDVKLSYMEAKLNVPESMTATCSVTVHFDSTENTTVKQLFVMLRNKISEEFACYIKNTARELIRVAEAIAKAVPQVSQIKAKLEYLEDKVRELAGDDC